LCGCRLHQSPVTGRNNHGVAMFRSLLYIPWTCRFQSQGIVRGPWQETVMEQDERGTPRINRHAYEMCVLLAVRECLRSKELWVFGANRYRNSAGDRPTDFVRERAAH
jgi:hypothetical protein